MIELPDDELDKLFRKSAEEFDPIFDPQDWNKLRKRLDEEDGHKPGYLWLKRWWPLVLAGLMFLGGTGLYLGLKKSGEVAGNHNSVQGAGSAADKAVSALESKKAKPDVAPKSAIAETQLLQSANTESDIKAIKIKPRSESKASGVFLESDYSKNKSGAGAILSKSSSGVAGKGQKNSVVKGGNKALLNENAPANQQALSGDRENRGENPAGISLNQSNKSLNTNASQPQVPSIVKITLLDPRPYISDNRLSIGGPSIPKVAQSATAPEKEIQAKPVSPKFAIRFGVSPDFSSVKFMKNVGVGGAVSLLGEYAIIPRLYLQAGAVRSLKKYAAGQGDYNWPGNWSQPMPESVDAVCKILELPLNLRFDIHSTERNRWFATAGTSSYKMRDEKYDYNYKKHLPGIKYYGWQGETGWYWFSHLNASVGYEYRLKSNLSLMAEPYITVPIKKVGYGEVNLFTTGVWISIRYSPFLK